MHNNQPPRIRNPTVRIQKSSPTPPGSEQSMLTQSTHQPFSGGGWGEGFPGAQYLNTHPRGLKHARYHKRASSGSSVTSAGPPSPLDPTTLYPHIATSEHISPYYENLDYMPTPQTAHTSKSLPIHTSDAFMYQQQFGGGIDMRRIHSSGADENASYAISGAPSVSSMSHNSPATPHTNYEVEYDDTKHIYGYPQQHTPAYHQSLHDVFPDPQNYQQMAYQPQQPMRMGGQIPSRPMHMANRLHAAQQDHLRTNSPVTSNPRDKSPFRQDSPYNASVQRVQQPVPTLHKTRTSISPKELELNQHDVEDDGQPPLFADEQQSIFSNRRHGSSMSQFYAPNFSNEPSVQIPQQYPFVRQQSRQERSHSSLNEPTPDFPAHLTSMESTMEEGPSEPSSQQALVRSIQQQPSQCAERPADTKSDAGTFSCTYHGCVLRFDTPQKLQKHKREGHRQMSPTSSAATSLALRNSQAGPHKCERTNPSTGKPCNSIFSRPYDLTRHEDTIHNGRKQKVRCHLCTEEKTFSRNDALTRHMRVVHPDTQWPGKQKRRAPK